MPPTCRIGFAGTDARTLLSALVVSTAKAKEEEQDYQGLVLKGTSSMPRMSSPDNMNWPVEFIPVEDNSAEAYAKAAIEAIRKDKLHYVIPLPEALLFNGLVNLMQGEGLGEYVAGLSREGSFLEADKIRGKEFCHRYNIPVAHAWTAVDAKDFTHVLQVCLDYLHEYGGAVLKYPFSAGGKGARIILNTWEIKQVYDILLNDYKKEYKRAFQNKEWPLLIESRMTGVEISFTILVDKAGNFQILPTALDYPERFAAGADKDNPITGGMGSISPHPFETPDLLRMAAEQIAKPMINGMRKEGILRPCVLYPGCFVSFKTGSGLEPKQIRVCEINIRPGEPEFQPIIRRLRNPGALVQAMFTGNLDQISPQVREDQISLCLALVTGPGGPDNQKGYPWSVTKYEPVRIDQDYLKKKNIQLIPSGMGYSRGKGFFSDGTRVAFLNANATVKQGQDLANVAEQLRKRLLNAYAQGKVRVVPREDPQGNRLAVRDDIGVHFQLAQQLLSQI